MQGLVLIDIQNDYFPNGRMALEGMDQAAANASQLLEHFRAKKYPIFHIQHTALQTGATFFLPGTSGAQIHRCVAPLPKEKVIGKHFPNSFLATGLQSTLEQADVKEVVFCGAMSHMCVDSTVRAGFDLGFRCIVAEDACATKELTYNGQAIAAAKVHAAFRAALAHPFARIIKTAQLVQNLCLK
ncbi:MAG: cysteine hydrolase family protein [Desulfobacteraceae bacterium]|nr:cysteine hydrolase family protein [Desulfobacteraceae bacterium]